MADVSVPRHDAFALVCGAMVVGMIIGLCLGILVGLAIGSGM